MQYDPNRMKYNPYPALEQYNSDMYATGMESVGMQDMSMGAPQAPQAPEAPQAYQAPAPAQEAPQAQPQAPAQTSGMEMVSQAVNMGSQAMGMMGQGQAQSQGPAQGQAMNPAPQGGGSPDYPTYGGDAGGMSTAVGGGFDKAGDAAISSGNPYAMIAGAASKVVGQGFNIYGAYKAQEQADKDYKMAIKRWEESERERKEDKKRELARQERQEGVFMSNFGQDLMKDLSSSYGGYMVPGQG